MHHLKNIVFLLLVLSQVVHAQNEVILTPIISPPYSPYISDYEDQLIISVQNTTAEVLEIKLTGKIEGDNGYVLFTKPNYLPSTPITLQPLETRLINATEEASEFLDVDQLETNIPGTLQRNILATGLLPEGNYDFCVEARDYLSSALLSATAPAGCIPINISYPDPPILISPECDAQIQSNLPIISWTPPIGNLAEALLVYDLYVVPLQPEENPFEAIDRAYTYQAGNPIIFRDLLEPFYAWQIYDLPLETGRTYAVQVVARDLNERVVFNNLGRSQVCTFQLEEDNEAVIGLQPGNDLNDLFGNFPSSSISGQLVYHWPGRIPAAPAPFGTYDATAIEKIQSDDLVPNQPLNYSNPILFDTYPINPEGAQPLANKTIKLVVRTVFKLPHYGYQDPKYVLPSYNAPGYGAAPMYPFDPGNPDLVYTEGQVLSVTQTDEQGNFNFNFIQLDSLKDIGVYHEGVGKAYFGDGPGIYAEAGGVIETYGGWQTLEYTGMYQVLRIEVESPYYCSPDLSIMIQPDQHLDLSPLVSLVKSYNLEVEVLASMEQDQQSTAGSALEFMNVEVLRSLNEPIAYDVPADEGQNLGEVETIPPGFSFRVASRGETNGDGKVVFPRMVKHPNSLTGKYYLRASSKSSNTPFAYITTVKTFPDGNGVNYSMQPDFTPFVNGNGIYPTNSGTLFLNATIFNSQHKVRKYSTQMVMEPDNPVVFGRVRHDVVGLPDVVVELRQNGNIIREDLTGPNGYFEFRDLEPGHNYRLHFHRYGYKDFAHPPSVFSLQMGTFKDFQELEMEPLSEVMGTVSNEAGDPVLSDVKLADSPWYPTELIFGHTLPDMPNAGSGNIISEEAGNAVYLPQLARFKFPAQSGRNLQLVIDPYSDQYFRDTFSVTITSSADGPINIGNFKLKEKLHRPRFQVSREDGGIVIGAKILIQGQELFTGRTGVVATTFASPATDFLVTVIPPAGSNLVPYQDFMTIPISKDYIDIPIELLQGVSISGMVTAGPDSLPVEGARVFLDDYHVWQYELPLVETFTDVNGNYTLSGIPEEFYYMASIDSVPAQLTIRATKSEQEMAYIGASVDIIVPEEDPVNLHLDILEGADLSEIWNLPIEVENLQDQGNGQFLLSGAFVDLPANPNFRLLLPNTRLDFYDVPIQMVAQSNGLLIPDPLESEIPLDLLSLQVGIMQSFQGTLSHYDPSDAGNGPDQVLRIIEESAGNGLLAGKVEMDLASFKFSYNYTGHIHLGVSPDEPKVPVFRPISVPYPQQTFSVMSLSGGRGAPPQPKDPYFWVHEFVASADRYQSYLREDTVALHTVLHTKILKTDPEDLAIEAGFIKILPSTILPFEQGTQLDFGLEAWTIESKTGWYFDKNNGGIHIPEAVIKTGTVDVAVQDVIIRYDDIDVGELVIPKRGPSPLSIAGVAPLNLLGNEPVFYFEKMAPTDLKGHWRIEVLGDAENPAATTSIPEFQPTQLAFNSFSLLSSGEEYLVVSPQTVWVYEVLELQMHSITIGNNFFALSGEGDLFIPEVPSNSVVLEFSKPGNQIVMDFEHFEVGIEGIGKVQFIDDNNSTAQQFQQGLFTAIGTIRAYDDLGNDLQLRGRMVRTPTECYVEVIQVNNQNQNIVCGQGGRKLPRSNPRDHAGHFSFRSMGLFHI